MHSGSCACGAVKYTLKTPPAMKVRSLPHPLGPPIPTHRLPCFFLTIPHPQLTQTPLPTGNLLLPNLLESQRLDLRHDPARPLHRTFLPPGPTTEDFHAQPNALGHGNDALLLRRLWDFFIQDCSRLAWEHGCVCGDVG
jgi:hypothetical protein